MEILITEMILLLPEVVLMALPADQVELEERLHLLFLHPLEVIITIILIPVGILCKVVIMPILHHHLRIIIMPSHSLFFLLLVQLLLMILPFHLRIIILIFLIIV